ncbi:hypothetical protein B0T21DRAFT_432982 [Apiosordaria backusii]|uniref:Uncharacterized protein n=1 Tax=Apiosordaria backusii TaxID=314023 RepID=A0AA40ELR8_9PEZI|nr:hypothetical protein B0T21DRAFT_432982 [Apiosordaria backusii]
MAPSDDKKPTSAEAFLFFSIIKNLRTRPDIDWEGVARDNGFKNAETAKVRYGQVRRKLDIDNWAPPVKASGSGVGKTEPDTTPGAKPRAATGAGVKKRAPASNARRKSSATRTPSGSGTKGKTLALDDEEDDSEPEAKPAAVKTPHGPPHPPAGGDASPISISSSTPNSGDAIIMRPPRNSITAALNQLSPTPIGRAQNEINIDSYISSLQTQTPFPPPHPQSLFPPDGVPLPDSVLAKEAIPIRGLGDVWTTRPVTKEAHRTWFDNLCITDQNRYMTEAVDYFKRQSGIDMQGEQVVVNGAQVMSGEWAAQNNNNHLQALIGHGRNGPQNGDVTMGDGYQNGSAASTSAPAASTSVPTASASASTSTPAPNYKGKKLSDIPYHPDYLTAQEQEEVDMQLREDIGFH